MRADPTRGKGKRGSLGAGAEGEGPRKAGAGGPSSLAWEEHLQVAQLREKAKAALGKPREARSAEELKALEWFIKQQLNTRYFQQIPPDLTKSFCQARSLRRVASHEPIFRQGEAGAEFFIIGRGVVDVYVGYRPSGASGAPSAGASDGEGLEEALAIACLQPDLARMGSGLDTMVGPRGVRLSGGQIQRTAAARAFVRRPDLLVVDDLSSALDVATETQVWQRLLDRPDRPALLVVSHRERVLRAADRIVEIG